MNEHTEIVIKGALCLLALMVVLWRHRRGARAPARRAGELLGLTAVVAVAAYFNFGLFHGRTAVHHWEQFHYFLGSKYFPELGYDGLYVASVAAQRESAPELAIQSHIRDLRDNSVVATETTFGHQREVKARFSSDRWREFVADNDHFVRANNPEYLLRIRLDHGYNPTPTWTFVARLVDRFLPASYTSLTLLGCLDPLLLVLMFVVVFRTYGNRAGCLAVIVFGLGYAWRYDWVGGALLRQDWLVAVVIGVCMLKRDRPGAAGAAFGYATMVRIFPVLFLLGPAILAARGLFRRERPRWALKLAGGFTLAVVLGAAAGSLAGRGPIGWRQFAHNLEKHRETWLTNNVGLENLLLYGPDTMTRRMVSWDLPEPWAVWQAAMNRRESERRPLILLATALLLAMIAAAAWRAEPDEAAILGVAAIFATTLLTCYYWAMLVLVPLQRRTSIAIAFLAINAGLFGLHLLTRSFEMIYGLLSWALAILFLAWTLPATFIVARSLITRRTTGVEG